MDRTSRRPNRRGARSLERKLRLFSRTLDIDRHLQVFAETRSATLLRGHPVSRVDVALETERPGYRCRVRVHAGGQQSIGIAKETDARLALVRALTRAGESLSRSAQMARWRRRRWQRATAGLGLLVALGWALSARAYASQAVPPLTPDHRTMVLTIHLSGGEPDALSVPTQSPLDLRSLLPPPSLLRLGGPDMHIDRVGVDGVLGPADRVFAPYRWPPPSVWPPSR